MSGGVNVVEAVIDVVDVEWSSVPLSGEAACSGSALNCGTAAAVVSSGAAH